MGEARKRVEADLDDRVEEAIAIVDRNHSYRFVSGAYARLLGVPRRELLGRPFAEVIGSEVYERISVPALEHCFAGRAHRATTQLPSLNGRSRPLDLEYQSLGDPDDVQAVVVVATEVDGARTAPRVVHRPPPHVAHERRLATMGSAITAAVHDLNNALAAVSMNLDSLDDDVLDSNGAIVAARTACAYSRRIISALQEFGQPPGDARPVPIAALVRQVAEMLRSSWPGGVGIDFEIEDPTIEVMGDELGLSRVFSNLYMNAAKAMSSSSGVIRVVVERAELHVPIMTDTGPIEAGEYCVVRVSDTGSGVSEHVRATMFQPFVTSDKNQGSGLGLAVTKAIVLDHGGGIVVESQRGLGSTFATFLPRRKSAQPRKWNSILSIPPPTAE